jgi:pyridoxine 5-phosphate synthase
MPKLGVNIDHVATLREARKGLVPDPVEAALICEKAGCDSIVCHLREDRRHISDKDVKRLRMALNTRLNLEMSVADEIVGIACKIGPDQATLVPERRQEITTEGGLDVVKFQRRIKDVVSRLQDKGIEISLFIDPSLRQIDASHKSGARIIEFHTGKYANTKIILRHPERSEGSKNSYSSFGLRPQDEISQQYQLSILERAAKHALELGFEVNAGHGLNYENTKPVARIKGMHELNIGHSIITRAVFAGLGRAVKEMVELVR